ncbi:MAG: hypothetical protein ACJATA_001874 [Sphingobacteriales bacterium]|jgi:hypothetical protein
MNKVLGIVFGLTVIMTTSSLAQGIYFGGKGDGFAQTTLELKPTAVKNKIPLICAMPQVFASHEMEKWINSNGVIAIFSINGSFIYSGINPQLKLIPGIYLIKGNCQGYPIRQKVLVY